jgi:hypothetical protein
VAYCGTHKLLVYARSDELKLHTIALSGSNWFKRELPRFVELGELPVWQALERASKHTSTASPQHYFADVDNSMIVVASNRAVLYRNNLQEEAEHIAGPVPDGSEYAKSQDDRYVRMGWDGQKFTFRLEGILFEWRKSTLKKITYQEKTQSWSDTDEEREKFWKANYDKNLYKTVYAALKTKISEKHHAVNSTSVGYVHKRKAPPLTRRNVNKRNQGPQPVQEQGLQPGQTQGSAFEEHRPETKVLTETEVVPTFQDFLELKKEWFDKLHDRNSDEYTAAFSPFASNSKSNDLVSKSNNLEEFVLIHDGDIAPFKMRKNDTEVLKENYEFQRDHIQLFDSLVKLERVQNGVVAFHDETTEITAEALETRYTELQKKMKSILTRVKDIPKQLYLSDWGVVRSTICKYGWNEEFWKCCENGEGSVQFDLSRWEAPEQTRSTTCKGIVDKCNVVYEDYIQRVAKICENKQEAQKLSDAHTRYKKFKRAHTAQLQSEALQLISAKLSKPRPAVKTVDVNNVKFDPDKAYEVIKSLEELVQTNLTTAYDEFKKFVEEPVDGGTAQVVDGGTAQIVENNEVITVFAGGDLAFEFRYVLKDKRVVILETRPWLQEKHRYSWNKNGTVWSPIRCNEGSVETGCSVG